MPDTVDNILMRYQSQNFKAVIDEQNKLANGYDKAAKAQDSANSSATKLGSKISKLGSFGRDLRQAGGFLGNDTLMALGNWADGISDIGQSIDAVSSKGNKLAKLAGVFGAVTAGAGVGASIYDATFGKLQGTDTGTILNQIGQLIQAGFNVDTLKVQAEQAFLESQKGVEFGEFQKEISDVGKSRLDLAAQMGIYTGPRDEEGMRAALKLAEEYIKTAPEWKPAAPGEKEQINYKLQAEVIAMGIREELQRIEDKRQKDITKQQSAQSIRNTIDAVKSSYSSASRLMQAGQTLQQGQAGARNVYASALYAIEREVGQKRADIIRNYAQSLLQLDQAYYAQRQKVAEQYGVETARMEADHQKNIRRMQEDHQGRLNKLVESRDALAVEDEIEQFDKERSRAEEDYAEMMQERQADYALQLREMEQAHQEQRNERQRAYQEQLRELEVQAQYRREQEAIQYALLLREIMQAFMDARNEFAASTTNNNSTVTNNNKSAKVDINASGATVSEIQSAVYGAIVGAFG